MTKNSRKTKSEVLKLSKNDVIRAENVARETKNNDGGTRNDRKTMSEVSKLAKYYVRIA